jgi:hypothetical protein
MRTLILIALVLTSVVCWAQQVIIYSKGKTTAARISATSDATFFTDQGNFTISDIDSIDTDDKALMDKFNKVVVRPSSYHSQNTLYIDDLPFSPEGELIFTEVIPVNGSTKDQLYIKAKHFFAKAFKSANDVIQLDDKESGTVVGKGFSEILINTGFSPVTTRLYYSVKIEVKEGRYRYMIEDLYYKSYANAQMGSIETPAESVFLKSEYYKKGGQPRTVHSSYKQQVLEKTSILISQLKAIMAATNSTKDEW